MKKGWSGTVRRDSNATPKEASLWKDLSKKSYCHTRVFL